MVEFHIKSITDDLEILKKIAEMHNEMNELARDGGVGENEQFRGDVVSTLD